VELAQVDADDRIILVCAECARERVFEQPPCVDGHGADCPEWACTSCGNAVLVGTAPAIAATQVIAATPTTPATPATQVTPAAARSVRSRPDVRQPQALDVPDLAAPGRNTPDRNGPDRNAPDPLDRNREAARIPA
jgi:hypothetical protein